MDLPPSAAGLLCPGRSAAELAALLGAVLRGRGYVPLPSASPPTAGYPLERDERLGFGVLDGLVRLEDLDAVFRVARWVSAALPGDPVGAARRYRGLPPTLKVFLDGLPVWKDGADPDHEVDFPVPTVRPAALSLGALPSSAPAVPEPAFAPWRDDALVLAFVRRESPLAP